MPSLQSYLFCALTGNPLVINRLHRRNNNWTDPPEVLRAGLERVMANQKLPDGLIVQPLEVSGVRGEWMSMNGTRRDRAFLYFHGGGYVMGSSLSSRHLVSKLVLASGIAAFSLDYRLAPDNPFPAALEDAVAAYRWLLAQGFEPSNLAFVGDSAGAGLVLAAMLKLKELDLPLPAAGVSMSPWTDVGGTGESMVSSKKKDVLVSQAAYDFFRRNFQGDHDPGDPLMSPLFGDLHGLPSLMIHVGDHEIMRDDSTRFASRALEAGVDVSLKVWPNMCHVFPALAKVFPESRQAIAEIGAFLDRKVGRASR